ASAALPADPEGRADSCQEDHRQATHLVAWKYAPHVEPAAFGAAGFDVPAGGLDHVLDDRQAEAAAAGSARAIRAEETFEEPRCVFLWNAGAVVGHFEDDPAFLGAERHDTGRALARVPDHVLDEVLDDGAEHPAAHRDQKALVGDSELEPDARDLGTLDPLVDHSP